MTLHLDVVANALLLVSASLATLLFFVRIVPGIVAEVRGQNASSAENNLNAMAPPLAFGGDDKIVLYALLASNSASLVSIVLLKTGGVSNIVQGALWASGVTLLYAVVVSVRTLIRKRTKLSKSMGEQDFR